MHVRMSRGSRSNADSCCGVPGVGVVSGLRGRIGGRVGASFESFEVALVMTKDETGT